jgi:hypothetical protein
MLLGAYKMQNKQVRLASVLSASVLILGVPAVAMAQQLLSTQQLEKQATITQRIINYYDSKGKIVEVWKGSASEAEKLLQTQRNQLRSAVSSQGLVVPQQQAASPRIQRVPNCNDSNTYWILWKNPGSHVCFRGGGSININEDNVYKVTSGKNQGTFKIQNGRTVKLPMLGVADCENCRWKITNVTIY